MALGAGFETAENIRFAFPTGLNFNRGNLVASVHRAFASYLHVAWTGAAAAGFVRGNTAMSLVQTVLLHGIYDYGVSLNVGFTWRNYLVSKFISTTCVWLSLARVDKV